MAMGSSEGEVGLVTTCRPWSRPPTSPPVRTGGERACTISLHYGRHVISFRSQLPGSGGAPGGGRQTDICAQPRTRAGFGTSFLRELDRHGALFVCLP